MKARLPVVAVLLSTFNGSRWLGAQLDSILGQARVEVLVTIRDDGSSDSTPALLAEYSRHHPTVTWEAGRNLGVAPSYLKLLADAPATADFVAFSDQDDIWLPDKLQVAVERLSAHDASVAGLYCGRTRYVDQDLRPLGMSRIPRSVGFSNALVENVATGCTIVMNRTAVTVVNSRPPQAILMHDWWCYLVASAFGIVEYDAEPRILYRQHGGNVVGGQANWFATLPGRVRRLRMRRDGVFRCSDQAREFERCHGGHLPDDKRALLAEFLRARDSRKAALALAASGKVRRSSAADDAILRALIAARLF